MAASTTTGTEDENGGMAPALPLTPVHLALHHTLFSSWYPLFRSDSPKATLIPVSTLQPDFLPWLEADSIVLPRDSGHISTKPSPAHPDGRFQSLSDDEAEVLSAPSDDDDDDAEAEEPPTFAALDAAIRTAIARYDGAVFPKLNWSAPQDAAWILPGSTLRCTTPEDVYLVLKSSDFVTKDVEQAAELAQLQRQRQQADERPDTLEAATSRLAVSSGSDSANPAPSTATATAQPPRPAAATSATAATATTATPATPELTLVLKKYFEMPKSHEFRCFVRRHTLVCLSQRDITFFEHLQPTEVQRTVRRRIGDFFEAVLRPRMPIADYIFDAYLTRDMGRVFVVDVNPFLPRTDPILWEWQEVEALAVERVARREERERGQEGEQDVASQSFPTYSQNMVPKDVIDVSNGQGIAEFARHWTDQLAAAQANVSDDE
ncbi:uncharacterized protein PFL1_04310 [Pseudozyma flocculosa PF-1]|uniref:Uncharacterized protein n=1 Tax=Pseudozyma flocculosa PF-1 TaxID=1277687 RepID=A0A061H5U4_9BASI|nr:uncharacterized protein PFL1_04310 [Pseudozyma flocculosa PF-1]EPQ27983.1 hypothetical protein PFL1_04310 [Pseudozyma flocculosa PF-1]